MENPLSIRLTPKLLSVFKKSIGSSFKDAMVNSFRNDFNTIYDSKNLFSKLRKERDPQVDDFTEIIIKNLINEALTKGLGQVPDLKCDYEKPSAGSTANIVVSSNFNMKFFIKIDQDKKTAEEAKHLIDIQDRHDLPDEFKNCFPHIYAVKSDSIPYGYLMESFEGFTGFEKICFSENYHISDIKRITTKILDLLLEAYSSSRNTIVKPNLAGIYIARIEQRLNEASNLDEDFKKLIDNKISINKENYEPPLKYIKLLAGKIPQYEPSFSTFVHGDSHPENILVKLSDTSVDIKFIDTKAWPLADYIFDIGKLCHYLCVTGPVELDQDWQILKNDIERGEIEYNLTVNKLALEAVSLIEERVEQYALNALNDTMWKERYILSLASNLLGLPVGRLKKGKKENAIILYAEGLKWLKKFYEIIM